MNTYARFDGRDNFEQVYLQEIRPRYAPTQKSRSTHNVDRDTCKGSFGDTCGDTFEPIYVGSGSEEVYVTFARDK